MWRVAILVMAMTAAASAVRSQVRVAGTVYDISRYRTLEAVSVMSSSGRGTVSDSLGRYSLVVSENDSIWFSYLNRPTPKYPVKAIQNTQNFDIALHVNTDLKEVRVMPPSYKRDSIQNREDYAKAFDFRKPGIGSSLNVGPNYGAGLDLDEFINMFHFRRNRRMLAFQERLLAEEEQRYIDHRFNRVLIIRLTHLRGDALNDFIEHYRPTIDFVDTATDYELQDYIKKSFEHYQQYRNMMNELRGR